MFNAVTNSPYLEAELAYRREQMLSHVEAQRARRVLVKRQPRRGRGMSSPARRSRIVAAG